MCWAMQQDNNVRAVVSVAGCLGYDVLVDVGKSIVKKDTFQLLVV